VPSNSTAPSNSTPPSNATNSSGGSGRLLQESNATNSSNSTPATNGSTPATNGSNATTTTNGTIRCCDYYEKGAGYEFSVCDGIGAIIRADLIGGANDTSFAMMPVEVLNVSPIWTDLSNLINNYCDARANGSNSSISSSNATIPQAWT
jgi:hypothetical protein